MEALIRKSGDSVLVRGGAVHPPVREEDLPMTAFVANLDACQVHATDGQPEVLAHTGDRARAMPQPGAYGICPKCNTHRNG
jgi:hypothetical protein